MIRRATSADLPEVRELSWRTISSSYRSFLGDAAVDDFHDSGADDAELEKHLATTDLLELDGVLVGLVVLDDDLVHLLLVDPARHREGHATCLMRHAETRLAAEGHARARLESFVENLPAMTFYASRGWTEVRRSEAPDVPGRLIAYFEKELR